MSATSPVDLLGIDTDLLLDFFGAFSRFERALKRAGFATARESRVSADWDCFGRTLRKLTPGQCGPVLQVSKYLQENPPKKQIIHNGQLDWCDAPDPSLSDLEQILVYVRRVRNNLFHGGKYPDPVGPIEEVARNKQLIQESLAVLVAVLKLPGVESVAAYFAPDG